jgi:hypothetical protein
MLIAQILTAVAATLAAVFSRLTLYVGGVREERRWRRGVLVDTVVQFLDASFFTPGFIYWDSRRRGTLSSDDRDQAIRTHADALTSLTRLRVLASASVVACAEKLHMADAKVYEMVVLDEHGSLPNPTEWGELEELRMERRLDLLNAVRQEFGLGRTKEIDPGLARTR